MKPQMLAGQSARSPWPIGPLLGCLLMAAMAVIAAGGCKSDLNQQLLERELRYQEDQIYQLQDELQDKCDRLNHVAGENASLRKQLGVSAADDPAPARAGRGRMPAVPPAATVPPSISIPDAPAFQRPGGSGPPAILAPPTLEGVPLLPAEPGKATPSADAGDALALPPPATASIDPAARPIEAADNPPALVQMSYDEPAGQGPATRLVVNRSAATAIDADGDGRSDGITLVVEPRDARERLAMLSGDIAVAAFDAAAAACSPPLAQWTIPATETATRFRPSGRRRGVFLELPWQGSLPAGEHIRVHVEAATPTGPLETEAVIAVH